MRQDRLVGLDAAHTGRTRRMGHPRQTGQRLVEMHVAIDQPRQNEITADVQRRRAVRLCGCTFSDKRDLPPGDADVDHPAIGKAAIRQECVDLGHASLTWFYLSGMTKARNERSITAESRPRVMKTKRERRSLSGHAARCRGACTKC